MTATSLILSALRSTRFATRLPQKSLLRALSTASFVHGHQSLLYRTTLLRPSPILDSIIFPRRSISIRAPLPPPDTVAAITRLETEADLHPRDTDKQLALFQGLEATHTKHGQDLVVVRWERMCEFDPTSPLLQSDAAFEIYCRCLVQTGHEASINAAVRRRDSLIASALATAAANESALKSNLDASTSDATSSSAPLSGASKVPLTRSEQIARSVMAGPTESISAGSSSTSTMSKWAGLLGSRAAGASNPLPVTIVERTGSWIPGVIKTILFLGFSGFFLLIIFAVLLENSGLMKAGPRQSQFEPAEGKTVKFSDVHGVDEAKDELQDIVAFLKDPTAFASLGGKLPTGVLLTGSPGTGKTMLARAVAGEAGVPFFFASGSDFEEMFVGVGAKRVRELFAAARKKQPAIIFIDELDAVGGRRSSRDQNYMKQTLNQLLVEMDGFQQTEGVIVIAATNFPESLDPALVRPGRFDRIIAVPLPDIRGRVQILQHHMRNITTSKNVDPTILARGTPGFSGADLQNMVNQAAIQASKEGANEVTPTHFEWAKDRIVMGAQRKSHYIEPKAKLLTAYHEGGHALVALYTPGAMPLHKVTCVPRGHALGVTSQLPEDDRESVTLKEYRAIIDVCMGGRVAEELIYGPDSVTSGASSDIRQATLTATKMVKAFGFSKKLGPVLYNNRIATISPQRTEEIESEVREIVLNGQERVTALLKDKEEELHRLAQALVEHETLDADEVRKVIKGEKIRNIAEILKEDIEVEVEVSPSPQ